ncbi:heptatricopeptide repeat-containing protein [Plasmodium brasilianum]|uniref:Heptatricopeptide repeat-containing protein n=1 Tax=Plasmodium brasilianum TaxID=5824 RepID=A0ACB9Y0S9_PLABR|nr:heptatricopeptide repeat-containing protein [Plasmodium brasilianum]
MHYLKKHLVFSHRKFINKICVDCNSFKMFRKKSRNFTSFRSIYECDLAHGNYIRNTSDISNACNTNGINSRKELLCTDPENIANTTTKTITYTVATTTTIPTTSSTINNNNYDEEFFKSVLFVNNLDDLKDYLENNLNELKNHEYILLLFKIYEIIFSNFYKTYEMSEILRLDNPNFKYVSLEQYIEEQEKKYDHAKMYRDSVKEMEEEEVGEEVGEKVGEEADEAVDNIRNVNLNSHYADRNKCDNMEYTGQNSSEHGNNSICKEESLDNVKRNKTNDNGDVKDTTVKHQLGYNKATICSQNKELEKIHFTKKKIFFGKTKLNILMDIYIKYIIDLENLNVKENKWKEYVTFFLTHKYKSFYDNIVNRIYKTFFTFSCVDVINFLYIIKRTNVSSVKNISMLAENTILQNVKYLDEEYLVRVGYVYLNNSNKNKNITHINPHSSKNLFETYINFVQNKIKTMNNQNFIKVLTYISNNNYKHVQFYKESKSEVYKRYNNFSEEQIIKLFYLYSKNITASDTVFMFSFINSIVDMFTRNSALLERQLVDVQSNASDHFVIAGMNTENKRDNSRTLSSDYSKLEKRITEEKENELIFPLSVLLNGIWANAKYFKNYPFLLKRCENIILKNIQNLGTSTISMLVWAYSTVENKSKELCFNNILYIKLKERTLQLYKSMTPKQLSNCLLGLSTTLGRAINNDGYVDTTLHAEVEQYLLQNVVEKYEVGGKCKTGGTHQISGKHKTSEMYKAANKGVQKTKYYNLTFLNFFTAEDLANICFSYSLVRTGSREFHTLIQSVLLNKIYDLSPQHISKIAYTYGCFYYYSSYTLLSSLQYEILQRVHQFSYHEISDILWCYCVNKFFDSDFWKCMLHGIDFEKVYNDARCSLLYSSLSYINLVDSSILDSYNVLRIFNFLRESYWNFQIVEYPHMFADEVVQTLVEENNFILSNNCSSSKDRAVFQYIQKVFDYEGFLIDIYFEYKNKKYAIFLYTPLNTTYDGYPLGENILKTRFIKKKNINIVHLVHNIWKNCGKDDRISLIHSQL